MRNVFFEKRIYDKNIITCYCAIIETEKFKKFKTELIRLKF